MEKEIQSKDFRIGNMVFIPQTKTYEQIGSIEENGRFTTKNYKNSFSSIDCLGPIELTEEILLVNCRFRKSVHDIRFKSLNSVRLKTTEKGFKFNYGESIRYIKYVHELQNLYFALNGRDFKWYTTP